MVAILEFQVNIARKARRVVTLFKLPQIRLRANNILGIGQPALPPPNFVLNNSLMLIKKYKQNNSFFTVFFSIFPFKKDHTCHKRISHEQHVRGSLRKNVAWHHNSTMR